MTCLQYLACPRNVEICSVRRTEQRALLHFDKTAMSRKLGGMHEATLRSSSVYITSYMNTTCIQTNRWFLTRYILHICPALRNAQSYLICTSPATNPHLHGTVLSQFRAILHQDRKPTHHSPMRIVSTKKRWPMLAVRIADSIGFSFFKGLPFTGVPGY